MAVSGCNRRDFLKAISAQTASLAVVGCLPVSGLRARTDKKPNVLLIMTDDQGWGDIHSHGNDLIDTPNLDKFAEEGARFDRFYVSSVCAPTRASLLTGRYHLRTGTHGVTRGEENMRTDEVTIADIFKAAGYATGCFGKWHNGAHYPHHPNGCGFDEFLGFCAGHWNNYFDTRLDHNGTFFKSSGYITDVLTDAAIRFIASNKNRPFFCYVPYNAPHSPWQVPDKYFDKYKSRVKDAKTACAYAMCENLDDNIAKLLHTLEEFELAEHTIVLFLTDNGPNTDRANGRMKGRKGSVDEGGIRVPLFVRWPGKIKSHSLIKPIAAHIDLLPTLVELCGIPMIDTKPIDGKSLAKLLTQPDLAWPDRMIFSVQGKKGSVRTQQYRAVFQSNRQYLYDMTTDPNQKVNLATKQPEILAKLSSAYQNWIKDVSKDGFDPIPIPIGYRQRPEVILPGHEAFLVPPNRKGISYRGRSGWANDWITNWTSTDAYPYWPIEVVRDGRYEITLMYICPAADVGATIQVKIGSQSLQATLTKAHNPDPIPSPDRVMRKEVFEKVWAPLALGAVTLKRGNTRLVVRALAKPAQHVMDLKAVHVKKI